MTRHAWVKVRVHCYICRRCGTGKVNSLERVGWVATFHTPDGLSTVRDHVPPCAPGPRTAQYLAKHQTAIACGQRRRKDGTE